jgi:hypothetical protein
MQIEFGTIIILIAVLIFYLRLNRIQRERVKRLRLQPAGSAKKNRPKTSAAIEDYSILSRSRRNWIIAGAGVLSILFGVLMYLGWLPFERAQEFGWLPVALGIIAFSWGFE